MGADDLTLLSTATFNRILRYHDITTLRRTSFPEVLVRLQRY